MKTNDYVKYLTETVVKYIEQPKDIRQKGRRERLDARPSMLYRWFGPAPYLIKDMLKKKR